MSLPKTKTEFKRELSHHQYGRRNSKVHGIYYDWKYEQGEGCGYKYMLLTWDLTKAEAVDLAWDLFNNPEKEDCLIMDKTCFVELHIAKGMSERCKVPISASLSRNNFSSPYMKEAS
jgi:hypothetical protein